MKNNFFFTKQFSNIYKKTSNKSEVTSQILYGEKFRILSKNKDWIKIKTSFDNYVGYIKDKNYVTDFSPSHKVQIFKANIFNCLLYTSPSPRDRTRSRMPSSA